MQPTAIDSGSTYRRVSTSRRHWRLNRKLTSHPFSFSLSIFFLFYSGKNFFMYTQFLEMVKIISFLLPNCLNIGFFFILWTTKLESVIFFFTSFNTIKYRFLLSYEEKKKLLLCVRVSSWTILKGSCLTQWKLFNFQ